MKKKKKSIHMKKFKGGHFRAMDDAVRIFEEDGSYWSDPCRVFRVTKRLIICEILMACPVSFSNRMQQIVFDKKTGHNIRGIDYGWLERIEKPKSIRKERIICQKITE